jgi:hypothetical protein
VILQTLPDARVGPLDPTILRDHVQEALQGLEIDGPVRIEPRRGVCARSKRESR